jgi:hypothetical protein
MPDPERPKEQINKEQSNLEELKKKLWNNYYEPGTDESHTNKKILDFSAKLKEKYPDYMDYRMWYVLVGGTPDYQGEEKFDFPGEDSVVEFINSLE